MAIHSDRVRTCFVLLVLVGLTACVTTREQGSRASYRHCASATGCPQMESVRGTRASEPRGEVDPIQSELLDVDYFHGLLVRAGVPSEQLPKDRRSLSPAEAVSLLSTLLSVEVGLRDFGPWRMAAHLLWEVANGVPVRWHFAEKKVADAMRVIFEQEGLGAIEIVHTSALPY